MKKKISLLVLCGIVLLGVCGCGNKQEEKTITYRCGTIQDEEYVEFTYNQNTNEYLTIKSYWQVSNIASEDTDEELKEYETMVSKFKKQVDLNINWNIENNTLTESTEIDLSKVDDDFMTYLENVGEKYDFIESTESIYFALKDNFYLNNKIDNEKITSFITENSCNVIE